MTITLFQKQDLRGDSAVISKDEDDLRDLPTRIPQMAPTDTPESRENPDENAGCFFHPSRPA